MSSPTHTRGAVLTVLVNVVWFVLATRNPSLHYHFAPFVAALLWPLSLRTQGRRQVGDARLAALASAGITLATTLVLQLAGSLDGPNFLHQGPAWPEAVLFAVGAAALGSRAASRERPGLLGGIAEGIGG